MTMKTTILAMVVCGAMMAVCGGCDTTEKGDKTEQEVCVAFETAVTPAILKCEGTPDAERFIPCACGNGLADADASQLAADCAAASRFAPGPGGECVNTPEEGENLPEVCLALFDAVPCIKNISLNTQYDDCMAYHMALTKNIAECDGSTWDASARREAEAEMKEVCLKMGCDMQASLGEAENLALICADSKTECGVPEEHDECEKLLEQVPCLR
jgi:hypothetical protein